MIKNKLKTYNLLSWYKALKEDITKTNLMKIKKNLEDLKLEKEKLLEERKTFLENLRHNPSVLAEDLKFTLENVEFSFIIEEKIDKQIKEKERELDQMYQAFLKAHQEKEVAETLKEKTKKTFLMEEIKKFYKEMDEITLSRKNEKLTHIS